MRTIRLFLAAGIVLSSGCSYIIARAGKDLQTIQTKQDMHAFLGEPVAMGVADEGGKYEEFRTRIVIAEDWTFKGEGYCMVLCMSCGAIELIQVPYQLCLLGKRSLLGQKVRVTYDKEGAIIGVERDGESVLGIIRYLGHPAHDAQPIAPTATDACK